MKSFKKVMALGVMAAVVGGSAALAAPAQIDYVQVLGLQNEKAQTKINAGLKGMATSFQADVAKIRPEKGQEGMGAMSMSRLFETRDLLNIGIETYVIKPNAANGESRYQTVLFEKGTGAEVSPAKVLNYGQADHQKLAAVAANRAKEANKKGAHIDVAKLEKMLANKGYTPNIMFRADGTPVIYFQGGEIAPYSDGMIAIPMPEMLPKVKTPVKK